MEVGKQQKTAANVKDMTRERSLVSKRNKQVTDSLHHVFDF